MKNTIRNLVFGVASLAAITAFAGVPPVTVIVTNSGKASFKGRTDSKGTFATGKLTPGNYVVQLSSDSGQLKGKKYAVVVSAGKKKVAANVAGDKFAGGGVAMKVDVAAGLNITGQVVADEAPTSRNNKKMVWIPPMLGSSIPGHWVEEDSAEAVAAKNSGTLRRQDIQKMQDQTTNQADDRPL